MAPAVLLFVASSLLALPAVSAYDPSATTYCETGSRASTEDQCKDSLCCAWTPPTGNTTNDTAGFCKSGINTTALNITNVTNDTAVSVCGVAEAWKDNKHDNVFLRNLGFGLIGGGVVGILGCLGAFKAMQNKGGNLDEESQDEESGSD